MVRIVCAGIALLVASLAHAQSDAGPLLTLLKSGRLAPEKQGNVIRLVAQRGNADDLAYLFAQAIDPQGFTPANRAIALEGLEEAVVTRKVVPKADLAGLKPLLTTGDEGTRGLALRLAGLWKVEATRADLATIAEGKDQPEPLRKAALEGLASLGGPASFATFSKLAEGAGPLKMRYLAVAGLARIAPDKAAPIAATVLAGGNDTDDPAALVAAFLDQKTGADLLAKALTEKKPNADAARMALRHMYGVGRNDAALTETLSKAAGIQLNAAKPTPAEIKAMAEEVLAKGDAARGEAVFRRLELSCFRCHALYGAGGHVGPDLKGVGGVSPPDYLLRAILDPAADVKEEYMSVRITTGAGKIVQGIVAEEDAHKVVLRDANGERKTVQITDIDERSKGGSLMPAGLANFLTRRELIDLVRFLGELGKPGPYALPTVTSVRRWRVLRDVPAALLTTVPDSGTLASEVLAAPPPKWGSAYARVSGVLPLDEVTALTGKKVLYLQGEIDVTAEGAVGFKFDSPAGLTAWVGDKLLSLDKVPAQELPIGKHAVTVRVDRALRPSGELRLDVVKPEGSAAEFTAVGGP